MRCSNCAVAIGVKHLLSSISPPLSLELQDLYEDLKDVAVLWSQLGLQLDLSKDSLDKIDSNVNSRDGKVEYCFTKVLQTWLTGDPAKVNKKTLVEAVRKTGNVRLANELESQGKL